MKPPSLPADPNSPLTALGDPPPAHAQPQRRAAFLRVEHWLRLRGQCQPEKEQADPSQFDFFTHLRGGCGFPVPGSQAVQGTLEVIPGQVSGQGLGPGASGMVPREGGFPLPLLSLPDCRGLGHASLSVLSFPSAAGSRCHGAVPVCPWLSERVQRPKWCHRQPGCWGSGGASCPCRGELEVLGSSARSRPWRGRVLGKQVPASVRDFQESPVATGSARECEMN